MHLFLKIMFTKGIRKPFVCQAKGENLTACNGNSALLFVSVGTPDLSLRVCVFDDGAIAREGERICVSLPHHSRRLPLAACAAVVALRAGTNPRERE